MSKHLTFFLLAISDLVFGQGQKREWLSISNDSIELIEIIDHQNLNYDWYYGRTYQIKKYNGRYILTRTDQYNRPFSFSEPTLESSRDTLNLANMKLLDKLDIKRDKDSLTHLANSVIVGRHPWYSSRIKLENVKTRTEIGEIKETKIRALLNAITAQKESFINYYLSSLDIDSVWLENNASRLWELYRPERFKVSEKSKEFCIKCLKNITNAQNASYSIQGDHSTSDYPFVEIRLINKGDTIFINTGGQKPFMLPWNIDGRYKSYHPKISIALANILPFDDYTNKGRLLGNTSLGKYSFEGLLAKGIIYGNCVDKTRKSKKWKLREK